MRSFLEEGERVRNETTYSYIWALSQTQRFRFQGNKIRAQPTREAQGEAFAYGVA